MYNKVRVSDDALVRFSILVIKLNAVFEFFVSRHS